MRHTVCCSKGHRWALDQILEYSHEFQVGIPMTREFRCPDCNEPMNLTIAVGVCMRNQADPLVCPDCGEQMVKTAIEHEDGSGWLCGWTCGCEYKRPKEETSATTPKSKKGR